MARPTGAQGALHRRAALALLAATAARVAAQEARRTVTLVVPFAPGGIADLVARAVAPPLGAALDATIVVDNKPSAGAIVGAQAVAQAAPDGRTLLLLSNANAVSAGLFRQLPFDVQRDFAPIGTIGVFDLALLVRADAPFKRLTELLNAARANPGTLTVGTIAVGSTQHLAAEWFKARAGVEVLTVPYKGTPAVLTALRTGEVDVAFEILGPMLAQVRSGVVRALAVTSDRRFPGLADVPTVAEAGLPGYTVASWNALAAPARTPQPVIDRFAVALGQVLAQSPVRSQLESLGVRAQAGTPAQLRALLDTEIAHWASVVRAARIERP